MCYLSPFTPVEKRRDATEDLEYGCVSVLSLYGNETFGGFTVSVFGPKKALTL